jgi:hypothetical protein
MAALNRFGPHGAALDFRAQFLFKPSQFRDE